MDEHLSGASLARVSVEANRLIVGPTPSGGDADVQQPCIGELQLLISPLKALQTRLRQLMDEWPENPLLEQLTAICGRLAGALISRHIMFCYY